MATPSNSYFPLTTDNLVNAITNGSYWSLGADRTIYWSISNGFSGEFWNSPGLVTQYVTNALAVYSSYANLNFVYTGYFANPNLAYQGGSNINVSLDGAFAFFSNTNQWALGFFPNVTSEAVYKGAAGDIFLNINSPANSLPSYDPGSEGWTLLLHELGHALGLKHTHDPGGTGRPTLTNLGLGQLDLDWFSVMTYNDNFQFNLIQFDPATPQVLDVIGIQYLYGINWSTNLGNSTYTLTASELYYTVWDAGGIDQVDASGSTTGWTIYLPSAQLSSLVTQNFGFAVPTIDLQLPSPKTFTWLEGAIENAVGSSFSDEIHGNHLANFLTGGLGNDHLDGGPGQDIAIFFGPRSQYSITQTPTGYTIAGPDGTDTLTGVELAQFNDTTTNLMGGHDPAVIVYQQMYGFPPTSAQLPGLHAFHQSQFNYALSIGVQDATTFVFEAFGLACAEAPAFQGQFGLGLIQNDASFATVAWQNIFHFAPGAGLVQWITDHVDFYETIYAASGAYGSNPSYIGLLARGATYGLIIGQADQSGIAVNNSAPLTTSVPLVGISDPIDPVLG